MESILSNSKYSEVLNSNYKTSLVLLNELLSPSLFKYYTHGNELDTL